MRRKTALALVLTGGLAAASVRAATEGHADGSHAHPALGARAEVLDVPRGATEPERLALLRADFRHRQQRIDWKSDSVVKRIRWALRDAERALRQGDGELATRRLDDAQALLERW